MATTQARDSLQHGIDGPAIPATLTIHEPVKEQTLVEAAQAYVDAFNNPEAPTLPIGDLMAALAREKAKASR